MEEHARILLVSALLAIPAPAEVILQFFEGEWDEIHRRTPEIAEAGYDGIWIPPPCKSPVAGTVKWANVGYSLYDRFDLGDIPQRGTVATRYGDRGQLRHMVDHLHHSDVKIYPDVVFNHNGNGPDYRAYPGMKPNDFHVWANEAEPGGWRRAPRMTAYDDINNGNGGTFQQELVSLIDIVTEPDGRFSSGGPNYAPEPSPFVRHPGQYDKYPFHSPPAALPDETVREMLNRWAHWLGDAMDYDGFRLDAGKHVVHEFYGGPGSGFLHEAQWNFDQRRGNTYDANVPDLYANEIRRNDMLMFNEIFAGGANYFDYWRNGNVRMRYLDFPAKIQLVDNAFNNGNLGVLATVGVNLDPAEGVMFVQSHDQPGPSNLELAYAWLLTKVGIPIVYFSGNNISWDDKNAGRTWVLPGTGNALGDYNNVVPNLVYIHNQFARGREWNRWADGDHYAHERYIDTNGDQDPDSGEGVLLVALNDSGGDWTGTIQTSFPPGTTLRDYTGNQPAPVTVNGSGQVTITVPARGGQGFVCYAPNVAEEDGVNPPLGFSQGETHVQEMPWVVPGGRDASDKPRTIPRISGNSVDIDVHYTDPAGTSVDNVIIKWGRGHDLNASATDFTDNGTMTGGFEQATYIGPGGFWRLSADISGLPEGLHTVKARLFNTRAAGLPAIYQTFTRTVYIDRGAPDLVIDSPADAEVVPGDVIAVIRNPDRSAGKVEYSTDGGTSWDDAVQTQRGIWKASISGLGDGARTLHVRAREYDLGAAPAVIQTANSTRSFTVASPSLTFAMKDAADMAIDERATIDEPFFTTKLTVPGGTTLGEVKLYWDGYEMTGLTLDGTTVSHVFDGRFTSGGVEQRLSGAFTNGEHFFEAVLDDGVDVKRITRRVVFNLYGANLTDSDGDGLPDDVELPGFTGGAYSTQPFPGDGNEDTIPNDGEFWTRTNPLSEDTDYDGPWDGDEDWDGDGVTNLTEVLRGFRDHGNAFHYDIYDAASAPGSSVASTADWTLTPAAGGTTDMTITYRPNNGPLSAAGSIEVAITVDGGATQYLVMTNAGGGNWTCAFNVAAGAANVDMFFQVPGGATTDTNAAWTGIDPGVTPPAFTMDGLLDSANYLVAENGMRIWAAVKGDRLYFATWSTEGGGNDHFLLLSNNFGNPEAHPWAKAGNSSFWFAGWPWLAADGSYHILNNPGSSGSSAMGTGGNVLEGEIDLIEVFGSVPKIVYLSALSYGDNDGDGINGQCPASWDGNNDVNIAEMAAVRIDSIRDEDLDGYHDGGAPAFESVVHGDTADANYGLRRFFIDELAGDSESITFRFTPNHNPGEAISDVELITNLNRRHEAVIQEDLDTVSTGSATYHIAHLMSDNAGTWEVTLPVTHCGAYRANVRYQLDGRTYYYTDGGQRRDLAIVVSPTKAHSVNMYEVNPAIVEATAADKAGRSTFRDLWMANTDRPDRVNIGHFANLGVNMLWLQPIHPIGTEGRQTDPETGQPFDPGSPYAVRDYWQVAPSLGADHTSAGAMGEFQTAVSQFDAAGIGVMMDGTFNHSAPDAVLGQGAADLFAWATATGTEIRNQRPQWYSKEGNFRVPASIPAEIAVAPDRSDFGKWNDVRDFYFGDYDALVKYASESHREEFLLERDDLETLPADTAELWEYFAYYPLYWLDKTGHPAGTPASESHKGIDGLRCDFAQGLPSEFWEYCINKTRSRKWDFLFMAESLDGYRNVDGDKQHGVGYRSARHFDILNENIVFHWRDTHFAYPANGPGTGGTPDRSTAPTYSAYSDRREAYANVVLLNNLTSHDEVFPSNDAYELLQAYTQLGALSGIPMLMYGQEAGAENDFNTYGFSGIANTGHNFTKYELNFGKSIPNFKRWNDMTKVWINRDWTVQGLYGRVNRARKLSGALRSRNEYVLDRTGGADRDPDMFAVAKYEQAGLSPSRQQVVLCFANTDYAANGNRSVTFDVSPSQFGIESGQDYNIVNLLAADPTAFVWPSDVSGADLIANGIKVILDQPVTTMGQAQYLRLVDTSIPLDLDGDGMPDSFENANGLDPLDPDDAGGDDDGDRQSNLSEFLAGTDPQDPNSRLAATDSTRTATGLLITWSSVPGRQYRIQWSDGFDTWTDVGNGGSPVTIDASAGTTTSYEVATGTPPSPSRRFYRIVLHVP